MSENARGEVFIVDDEPTVRDALANVLRLEGYRVSGFANGASFLEAARARVPTCILLDVHMPGRSGLDILKELNAQQYQAPIFIISGQGDIPMAVEAIRNGALDFIQKPFDAKTVVTRIAEAVDAWARRQNDRSATHIPLNFPGCDQLTMRERDVLMQITGGASNKEAGRGLGISPRTVEVHRARILEKLGAKNAADLVRIVMSQGRSA
jgi:two-component system, LuxR family, response regulator FixJ